MSAAEPMRQEAALQPMLPAPGTQPPGYPVTQPGQTIMIQSLGFTGPRVYPNYARVTSSVLGLFRICIGILSIVLTIAAIIVDVRDLKWDIPTTSVAGTGIWCGLFFILAGSFGVAASKQSTMCLIVTNMVLAIVSVSVFGLTYIALSAVGLEIAKSNVHTNYYYSSSDDEYRLIKAQAKARTLIALFGVMIALALAECVCDICSSVICCKAVCCGYSAPVPVQYIATQPGQQLIYQNNPSVGQQPVTYPYNPATSGYPYPAQGGPQPVDARSGGDNPPPAYGSVIGEHKTPL